jgi:26S proteasome regulatory subunit N1
VTLESLAYAGSGNVLKVQELLGLCGEHGHDDEDSAKPDAAAAAPAAGGAAAAGGGGAAAAGSSGSGAGGGSSGSGEWRGAHQFPAVLGLALIAMGEPLGARMAQRALEHLLQYGEPAVR